MGIHKASCSFYECGNCDCGSESPPIYGSRSSVNHLLEATVKKQEVEIEKLTAENKRMAHDAELWQFAAAEEGSFWAEEIAKSLAYEKETKEEAAAAGGK